MARKEQKPDRILEILDVVIYAISKLHDPALEHGARQNLIIVRQFVIDLQEVMKEIEAEKTKVLGQAREADKERDRGWAYSYYCNASGLGFALDKLLKVLGGETETT